jgi:hypothetical protein
LNDVTGSLVVDTPWLQAPSGVGVSYRVVTGPRSSDIARLAGFADGFAPLASTPISGAVDYVRSAILRDGWLVVRLR